MDINAILTGSFGVGKTSIFNRFFYDDFSVKYYGTIGVRSNKKEIEIKGHEKIGLSIWDVAGEVHQNKVPVSYFLSKNLIIYVIDLNRTSILGSLADDIAYLKQLNPHARIKIVGNKYDLVDDDEVQKIRQTILPFQLDGVMSAKTGENVSKLLSQFAAELVS